MERKHVVSIAVGILLLGLQIPASWAATVTSFTDETAWLAAAGDDCLLDSDAPPTWPRVYGAALWVLGSGLLALVSMRRKLRSTLPIWLALVLFPVLSNASIIYQEDFETGNLNDWIHLTHHDGNLYGSWTMESGVLQFAYPESFGPGHLRLDAITLPSEYIVEFDVKTFERHGVSNTGMYAHWFDWSNWIGTAWRPGRFCINGDVSAGFHVYSVGFDIDETEWHHWRFEKAGDTCSLYVDDDHIYSVDVPSAKTGGYLALSASGGRHQFDNLVITQLPISGACIFPDFSCVETTEQDCTEAGGSYQGDGTECPFCSTNLDCAPQLYCAKPEGYCDDVGVCTPRPENCPTIYVPVCGCDGHTYTNDCEAAMYGVSLAHRGECGGGARTLCSTLGNDRTIYSRDVFRFYGVEGETITLRVEADPPECGVGKKVAFAFSPHLMTRGAVTLPYEVTRTLRTSGYHYLGVGDSRQGVRLRQSQKFIGDYCVTLEASPETVATFVPALDIE
ncbi:MAG: Kazal-type serine protease inhibitor domain-containing protein [Thermodesulfobacteriota bacterium]|nr:Kazal-type serine protease inhibitor domain-containing protein [Thermodesulfobacteriota bacterium]